MIEQVIKDFKWFYDKGFITERDGNACFIEGTSYIITASGVDKSEMDSRCFLSVDSNMNVLHETKLKPSIETAAHLSALLSTGAKASVHVHSPNTVALFKLFENREQRIESILNNDWPELCRYTNVGTTVGFYNPGSTELHEAISNSFVSKPDIIVLQQHGVLSTGSSLSQCKEHISRLEHISTILLKIASIDSNIIK